LFGDAASATLISADEGFASIGNFCLGTDGKGADNLILKNGAFRHKNSKKYDGAISNDRIFVRDDNYLYMNGREIFNFAAHIVPELVQQTLARHHLDIADIDLFVFHQANRYILNFIRKSLDIPDEKFYINLANTGNTVSASIPIALKTALDEGRIKQKSTVTIAGVWRWLLLRRHGFKFLISTSPECIANSTF
jgi:3-oxoacyl-[acyl-carrier-protein] synthase-3